MSRSSPSPSQKIWDVTPDQVYHIVKRACGKAGVRGGSPHRLRHSFATHMIEAGASVQDVSKLLGHSSLDTTMRYVDISEEAICGAHRKFHPMGGEK